MARPKIGKLLSVSEIKHKYKYESLLFYTIEHNMNKLMWVFAQSDHMFFPWHLYLTLLARAEILTVFVIPRLLISTMFLIFQLVYLEVTSPYLFHSDNLHHDACIWWLKLCLFFFLTYRFLLSNQCLSHSIYIYLLYMFSKHVESYL